MVQVLYAAIDQKKHDALLSAYLGQLPSTEQEKIVCYRNWADAQLRLLGKMLLKEGIRKMNRSIDLNTDLAYNAFGKPFIKDHPIYFNIAHSRELVVCALTSITDIGIDIERNADIAFDRLKAQMTCVEWNRIITAENPLASFYIYWTQKEAVIKAHGKGLSIPLQSFQVNGDHTKIGDKQFFLTEMAIAPSYTCFIASPQIIAHDLIAVEMLSFPA